MDRRINVVLNRGNVRVSGGLKDTMNKQTLTINGDNFSDLVSFFKEMDRVLTKDLDWDTGHNLDAFNDLLRGGYGVYEYEEPINLTWRNISKSKRDLGFESTKTWYEQKIDENKGMDVQYFKDELKKMAEKNGKTLFDIIIEIIANHKQIDFKTEN
jgi:RNAse (barnase) inhibitor barstar